MKMWYGLVHYPDIVTRDIERIRRKYDPTAEVIGPHITVMFPVPEDVGKETVVRHISGVLAGWQPFPIHIKGLCRSWDNWLFLTLEEGRNEIIQMYEEIYRGPLLPYRRDDIEFIPHIGLGLFIKRAAAYDFKDPQRGTFDEEKYQAALEEAEVLNLDYQCVINKLNLLELTDDFTSIASSQEFMLSG